MSPPHGRTKVGSLPLGGKARSAKGAFMSRAGADGAADLSPPVWKAGSAKGAFVGRLLLILALLLGGPASDRLGRVRVLLPLTVLVGLASLLFLVGSGSLAALFAARFVQGLASGAVFSVGSAWLQDLAGPAQAPVAARRASIAQTAATPSPA